MKTIYFDNNATTKVAEEVLEEMLPYFSELYGNPSSMHGFGGKVGKKITEARERVADLLNAEPSEIIFTSCGTESDNSAILSALNTNPQKRHLITSKIEHPAVLTLAKTLEKRGYRVTYLGVDSEGLFDLNELENAIQDDTALISVMYANNETGVISPVPEMAEIAKSHDIMFHTDAVQAVGKIPLDLKKSNIDMLSISGHKLHAPKGVGALYVKRGTKFRPFLIGGHQEKGRRGGTENVASIIGIGKAAELAKDSIIDENTKVKALRDKLEIFLLNNVKNSIRNGNMEKRLPNTSSISFEYIEGEAILLLFNDLGICASSGSACTSGSLEPSHVLRAMGVPFTAAHGSIRFSLSRYNTEKEVDYVLKSVPPIIDRLREMSPFWKDGKPTQSSLLVQDEACGLKKSI